MIGMTIRSYILVGFRFFIVSEIVSLRFFSDNEYVSQHGRYNFAVT